MQTSMVSPSGREVFKVKIGQAVLAVAMIIVIFIIILFSFNSFRLSQQSQTVVLSEESDSAALVFVQREAFGLVIELERYFASEATVQDLIVARSTLSQRLNVVTSTGRSTFEVAGSEFRDSLRILDSDLGEVIRGENLSELDIESSSDAFLSETRLLTRTFQEISRQAVQSSVEARARVDLVQGGLSVLALTLGMILFFWVVRDINRGFRRAFTELEQQQALLTRSEQDFLAIEELDQQIAKWNYEIEQNGVSDEIVEEIQTQLLAASRTGGPVRGSAHEGTLDFSLAESGTDDVSVILQARLTDLMQHINNQVAAKKALEWEREHCGLTDLLNRRGITRELEFALTDPSRLPLLVVSLDIDSFSSFNNSMGPVAGDQLLKAMADSLKQLPFAEFYVARVASDEFAVLVSLDSSADTEVIAKMAISNITKAANFTTVIEGNSVTSSSCIGWHLVTQQETVDEIVAKTGAALRIARSAKVPGTVREFITGSDDHLLQEFQEQLQLRQGLSEKEIIPYFQPIVDLKTGQIKGFECLARWASPERGIIMPDEFIPVALRSDLLGVLFESVLESAAQFWKDEILPLEQKLGLVPYFAVNVDPTTLGDTNFGKRVNQVLETVGLEPSHLVLELTEQTLGDPVAIERLRNLQSQGIQISLDDFGTGYSNLSRLAAMPLNVLKVDRSFLPQSQSDERALDLLRTIHDLASTAGLKVVVEGIETEEMVEMLTDIGFSTGQGYLFGKAAPAEELVMKLQGDNPNYLT